MGPVKTLLRRLSFVALSLACVAGAAEEVPFITTPDNVATTMLQIARVNAQDFVIDLGSGDGRIPIAAAM